MSNDHSICLEKEEPSTAIPEVTLHLSAEEADAMLSILLHVASLPDVPVEMTDRLLCRVAELQRQLDGHSAITPNCIRTARRVVPVPV